MKAAKLLREGCRTAANLLRPRMDMTEGFETLESLWPDTKGECYVDRPADWLTPEKPVALSVIIPAYNEEGGIEKNRTGHTFKCTGF